MFITFITFDTFIPFLYLVVDYLIIWCHRSMDTRVDHLPSSFPYVAICPLLHYWPLSLSTLVTSLIPSVAAEKYSSPFPPFHLRVRSHPRARPLPVLPHQGAEHINASLCSVAQVHVASFCSRAFIGFAMFEKSRMNRR